MSTPTLISLSFEDYLTKQPNEGRYELINGGIVRIQSIRWHDDIADCIQYTFNDEF